MPMNKSGPVIVCVLNDDPTQLESTHRVLSSAGWRTQPFSDPDTFLSYACTHLPDIAILDFGGPRGRGLEVRGRLREVSPETWAIVALKPHHNPARRVLPDHELIDLIEQYVATSTRQFLPERTGSPRRKVDVGCCA
jgi:CheY-like chemotaxis protein